MDWTHVDMALVNASVLITLASDSSCQEARIALGTAAPVPFRSRQAEAILKGRKIDDAAIDEAAAMAAREASPMDYHRGSETYKRHIIAVFVERGLREALKIAQGKS